MTIIWKRRNVYFIHNLNINLLAGYVTARVNHFLNFFVIRTNVNQVAKITQSKRKRLLSGLVVPRKVIHVQVVIFTLWRKIATNLFRLFSRKACTDLTMSLSLLDSFYPTIKHCLCKSFGIWLDIKLIFGSILQTQTKLYSLQICVKELSNAS